MTLVAAFCRDGVPFLIGDMLVTATATGASHSYLATAPSVAAALPEELGFRVAETRKKVHIVGPNLAVAWCGSKLAASDVIGRLFKDFSASRPSIDDLQDKLGAITDYAYEATGMYLIGWIVGEAGPICFRWNSMWPSEVFPSDSHFDGSGEDMFKQVLLEEPDLSGSDTISDSPIGTASLFLLAKLSKLMAIESWDGGTLRKRFGYGYEIVFFDGEHFRYIDEIAYLTWDVATGPDRVGHNYSVGPTLVKYKSMGAFSIMQTTHIHAPNGIETYLDLVTPVHDQMKTLNAESIGMQPVQATYYCNFLRYRTGIDEVYTGSFVTHSSVRTFMGHDIRDGKDYFWLNMKLVRDAMGPDQ